MVPGLEPADLPADAIEVGRVSDAWGIKGWFKVLPYSAEPEALLAAKQWFLLPAERGAKTFTGVNRLSVADARTHADAVVAAAHGVQDRDGAEALRGARIFISRSSFPTAATDEYYWVDLIGLEVVNREGLTLGTVKDLMSTGPQTVLVVGYGVAQTVDDALLLQGGDTLVLSGTARTLALAEEKLLKG